MKKELEALDGIKKVLAKYISEKTGVSEEKHFEYLQYDTEIGLVAKALTPPTADEVCEAIYEVYGAKAYYENGYFLYRKEEFYNQPFIIAYKYKSGLVELTKNVLPPHLITLIGRFYQSLEEEKCIK